MAVLTASCVDSSDSWTVLTSWSLPTTRISQMLRYFSTWRTTRVSITSSKSFSLTFASFFVTRSRMSGVTSKLRPMMPVAMTKNLASSENLLPVRGGRNVQFVSIFRHGPARNVNPLVIQNLHDLGVGKRLARILGFDVALDLFLHRERRDVLARIGVDAAVEEVLHEEQSTRRVHVLVGDDAGDGRLVHLDVVRHVAQHERAEIVDPFLQELALMFHDRFGHFVDRPLPLVE